MRVRSRAEALSLNCAAVEACSGSDVTRSVAARKGRVLISFPGVMLPSCAGQIGELQGLQSAQPRMVIRQPGGVIELQGSLVRPASSVLTLSCDGSKRTVACQDVFSAMIAFTKAVWRPDDEGDTSALPPRYGEKKFVPPVCASHGHIGCGRPVSEEEAADAGYDGASTISWFSMRKLVAGQAKASDDSQEAGADPVGRSKRVRPATAASSTGQSAGAGLLELYGPLAGSRDDRSSSALSPPRPSPPTATKRSKVMSNRRPRRPEANASESESGDDDDDGNDEVAMVLHDDDDEDDASDSGDSDAANSQRLSRGSGSRPRRRRSAAALAAQRASNDGSASESEEVKDEDGESSSESEFEVESD